MWVSAGADMVSKLRAVSGVRNEVECERRSVERDDVGGGKRAPPRASDFVQEPDAATRSESVVIAPKAAISDVASPPRIYINVTCSSDWRAPHSFTSIWSRSEPRDTHWEQKVIG